MTVTDIKRLRRGKGMTQADLAQALGVTQGVVSMIELGFRTLSPRMAKSMAIALDADIESTPSDDADKISAIRKVRALSPEKVKALNELL